MARLMRTHGACDARARLRNEESRPNRWYVTNVPTIQDNVRLYYGCQAEIGLTYVPT